MAEAQPHKVCAIGLLAYCFLFYCVYPNQLIDFLIASTFRVSVSESEKKTIPAETRLCVTAAGFFRAGCTR